MLLCMNTIKTTTGEIIKISNHPVYSGIKPIDKNQASENIAIMKDVLEKNGVLYFLSYGTLLGAVREHDFISHDEDIDIVIKDEFRQAFIDILPQFGDNGFYVVRYDARGLLSLMRNNEYIDFYFFKKYESGLRYCCGYLIPEDFMQEGMCVEFLGDTYPVHSRYEDFLRFQYGDDWRTPVKYFDFNKSGFSILVAKLKFLVKSFIPLPLLAFIISKKERRILEENIQMLEKYRK